MSYGLIKNKNKFCKGIDRVDADIYLTGCNMITTDDIMQVSET